ncbi:MAG: ABC transporter permease [Paludibacter sp.]
MNAKNKHIDTNSDSPLGVGGRLSFFDINRWQEIWFTITHNKSRSFLTAFGVFWGMFMLVVMVGAGVALQRGMSANIEGFATNSCFFWTESTTEPYKGFKKGRNWNIVNEDLPIIIRKIPEIQYMAPVLFGGQSANNTSRKDKSGTFSIKGNYPSYNKIVESKMIFGRYINDIDMSEKRKVCVIGERVYEVLFAKAENPIGKNIQVNGIYFQVIGVARNKSTVNIGGKGEETIVLPFSTMQQAFNQGNKVHFIAATAQPGIKVKVIEDKISEVLRTQHDISSTDKAALTAMNIEDQFTMFLYLGLGIGFLIWFVGMGTLIAGGIGVSNIMLVTVRERTKEIGIRRALGATPRNIITQILTESIVLTIIAGISGLMLGVGLLQLVGYALSQSDQFFKDPQISFSVGVAAIFILLVIGTLAGFIPANRAMSIKPIEAIREE